MPRAFVGGSIVLPSKIYRPILGILLIFSGVYLVWRTVRPEQAFESIKKMVPLTGSIAAGGGIGFMSGLSGIGGGVLLSPFFLITGWARARQTTGLISDLCPGRGDTLSCDDRRTSPTTKPSYPAFPYWSGFGYF